MTDPVVTPPAAAAAPGATTPVASLIDSTTVPAAAPPPATTPPPTPPADEWFYADGVKAAGAKPDWFKHDKYKTLEAQAKAYPDLERRFGAFVGAPEGEYVTTVPEKFNGAIDVDTTDPRFVSFAKWARDNNLSQKGYDELFTIECERVAAEYVPPPTLAEVVSKAKTEIGANADARLKSVGQWAQVNLDDAGKKALEKALSTDNPAIAATLMAIEATIVKTRQPVLPKPGDTGALPPQNELKEIDKMHAALDPKNPGKRLYETSPEHRLEVEKRRNAYFSALPASSGL